MDKCFSLSAIDFWGYLCQPKQNSLVLARYLAPSSTQVNIGGHQIINNTTPRVGNDLVSTKS
jgi:hypothetical protein